MNIRIGNYEIENAQSLIALAIVIAIGIYLLYSWIN